MVRVLAALLVAGVLAGCSASARPRGDAAGVPTREVLPNGVVLIVHEHRASDVVALQLWVRAGGRDEEPTELGLSHYLEHMVFKGTPTRPPGSIDRLIEGVGGQSNAFTAQDSTHYDLVLPAGQLRTGLALLADIAVNASFEQSELDAERKVIVEEMRLNEDAPDRSMLRRLYELVYQPHAYGRSILGSREVIGGLTRQQLRAFYEKFYVPRYMTVVVVGAVDRDEVRRAAAATFGRLDQQGVARRPWPAVTPLEAPRRFESVRPEQQAWLGMAWRTAATNHPDVYAVDVLTYILGDSPSSRLNQVLRERERLVFSIEAGYGAWQLGGAVTVIARLDAANVDRAEATVIDVIRRIKAQGVTEEERQRAIVTAEATYAFDIETAEGLAKTFGQAETTWTLADELAYLARLRQVSAADIQAVARKYFDDTAYARVRFIPGESAR
jgi:zinc protease